MFRGRRGSERKERHDILGSSIGRVSSERPAGAPEFGSDDRVPPERTPCGGEGFGDTRCRRGVRHEGQRELLIAGPLIDAAGNPVVPALEYPAQQAFGLAFLGRSVHACSNFNRCASESFSRRPMQLSNLGVISSSVPLSRQTAVWRRGAHPGSRRSSSSQASHTFRSGQAGRQAAAR